MNEWKPLLPFGDSTLIETVVTTALEVCRGVVLVVGYRGEELAGLFDSDSRVKIVRNPKWEEGMLSSILAGLDRIEAPRFFIVPADMPYLTAEVYRALMTATPEDVVVPVHRGRRGHPVLIDSGLIDAIFTAGRSKGSMREVLEGENFGHVAWEDDSVLRDLDTPEDYRRGGEA